jgi:LPXTG-motif cell wall-anchored protein
MTHSPPVPAANRSPYPIQASPQPPRHDPVPPVPAERGPNTTVLALVGAGLLAVIGGVLLYRRR